MTSARLLLCGLAAVAAARAGDAQAPAPQTDITSVNMTSVTNGDETTTVFTEQVVVVGDNIKITCDYLKAVSSKAASSSAQPQFRTLLARGHVHIVQGGVEATCGQAEVVPAKQLMTLTDHPVVTDHARGMVATGEPLILTGTANNYQISGTHPHITGLPSLQKLNAPAAGSPAK